MVFVSNFNSEKNQLQIGKNGENSKKNFIILFAKKIQSEKNFNITFNLKRSLHKPRKINETINPKFGLGHEIYELKQKKNQEIFFKKFNLFWHKKEGVIRDAGNFGGLKSGPHPCCLS